MKALKKKNILVAALLGVTLVLLSIILVVQFYTFNQGFYEDQFIQNGTHAYTGIEPEDLSKVTERLIGYLMDRYDTLDIIAPVNGVDEIIFEGREVAHMVDVKNIFMFMERMRIILVVLLFLEVVYLYFSKAGFKYFAKALVVAGGLAIAIAIFMGALVMLDFSKYFVRFHEIFFTNDLWLLNPKTDILIQMLPLDFFIDITTAIVTTFLMVNIVPGTICTWYLMKLQESN